MTTVVLLSADKVLCRKKFRYPQISHIESLRRSINTKNGNASGRCPFTTSSKHEVRDHNSALKKHNQNQEVRLPSDVAIEMARFDLDKYLNELTNFSLT